MAVIHSQVNPRLLRKADRLFTGTVSGRVAELLQNARRAGASHVEIENHDGEIVVRDDGRGIEDFASLLDLGGSGWAASLEANEDPAGVGLFCLAPRRVIVRSRGKAAVIEGEGWYGAPVPIDTDPEGWSGGTALRFADEPWRREIVEPQAVFSGLQVFLDGEPCAREPFLSGEAVHRPDLACRVQVTTSQALSDWHRRMFERTCRPSGILVNFHGQVVELAEQPIGEPGYVGLVDLTGEPTGLRLMLPARTRLVDSEALEHLRSALERETYRFIARQGEHRLPYRKYLRGHELGVDLPEALPTYEVGGLVSHDDGPAPCAVRMPDGWPLEKCYHLSANLARSDDIAEANAHLLAALGETDEPFVPVWVADRFAGYSWADLPRIEHVEVRVGRTLQDARVRGGEIRCVDALAIEVKTSDGRGFGSAVPMAVDEDRVLVTPEAEKRVDVDSIWFHLGGADEAGDTLETQQAFLRREIEAFWQALHGPEEHLRERLVEAAQSVHGPWRDVRISRDGSVTVHFEDGTLKTWLPRGR